MGGQSTITKPHIESDIAIYSLKGEVNEIALESFFSNLAQHRVILKSLKVVAVFFSLKEITKIGAEPLKKLYKRLEELNGELKIPTGITYYTSGQYQKLKKDTKDSALALVKTPKVAALVMGTARISKEDTVLVYDDDLDEKHLMFSEFISKGYSVVAAKDREDFKKRASHKDIYGTIVRESRLSGVYRTVFTSFREGYYVYTLRGYVDDGLSSIFEMKSHKNRLADGFRAFLLDFSRVTAIHIRAGFFIKELERVTKELGGDLFIFGADTTKLSTNVVEIIKKSGVDFLPSYDDCKQESVKKLLSRVPRDIAGMKIAMTKELIQSLPLFSKSTVSTINVFSGEKSSSKMGRKSVEEILKKEIYTSGMLSFDGDLSGTIFFLGNRKLLKQVSKVMLEDENIDQASAVDLTSEIMNTIGGKIKMAVSKQNIPISISLPKSFREKEELREILGEREGVSIELSIDNNSFYLFVIGECLEESL